MSPIAIKPVTEADIDRLHGALTRLSEELGDTHRATAADVMSAGFGPVSAFHALLAERGPEMVGAIMFSPVFSTVRGSTGVYVSDLWVSDHVRGSGTGRALLSAALNVGRRDWGARYVRLVVYDNNHLAHGFYCRLGFTAAEGERFLTLEGDAAEALRTGE